MLIVFEGPDGVGKTTQALLWKHRLDKLYERSTSKRFAHRCLEGMPAYFQQPYRFFRSRIQFISNMNWLRALYEFMREREEDFDRLLSLSSGDERLVTLDRYVLSSFVYQVCDRGITMKDLLDAHEDFLLVPDLTIVYSLPEESRKERIVSRGDDATDELKELENVPHLTDKYLFAIEEAKKNSDKFGPLVHISLLGKESVGEVHTKTLNVIANTLPTLAGICHASLD